MVRFLKGYNDRYRIFVVSRSKEKTAKLLELGICVGEIAEGMFTFYPDDLKVHMDDQTQEDFEVFSEDDVLEISENGLIYRWYSDVEGDAGIATTARCNSNCIMCPAGDNERRRVDMPIEHIKTIIEYMPEDLYFFTITGGEPTLIGDDAFIEVYRTAVDHFQDAKILLLTNGRTLGDKGFFEKFVKEKTDRLRIAIPIHGSTPERHDSITQSPGGFAQTLRGIANVISAGIELEIRVVISKLNMDDMIGIAQLIIRFFHKVRIVHFIGLEMRGNCAVNSDKVVISYQEAFASAEQAIKLLMKNGIDVALYNFPYCMIKKEFWPLAKKSISAYKSNFYDECSECYMKEFCCGIFTATKDFYKPKVFPIEKEVKDDSLF